jgi:ferrous iron transport protein A
MAAMRRGLNSRKRRTLADLAPGEEGTVEVLDLSEPDARRLMELGFVPGARVVAGRKAPGGDPRVFRVDGSEFALRKATAARVRLRTEKAA